MPSAAPVCVSSLPRLDIPRKAKIRHERVACFVDQYVGRFEIAMQDATLVSVMHGPGDIGNQLRSETRIISQGFHGVSKRTTLDKLHREEMLPFVFPDLVDRHNAPMIEPRSGFRFVSKTLHVRFGPRIVH